MNFILVHPVRGGGGGGEGVFASPEFGDSEKRTERETDNLLLIAPPESKSKRSPWMIM